MQKLKKFLKEINLLEDFEKILPFTKKHLKIILSEKEDYKMIGNSRMGGLPDLPSDIEWPKDENGYMEFIMQINLDEIINNLEISLPEKGTLYVFVGNNENTGNVEHKIIYSIKSKLEKHKPVKNYTTNLEKEYIPYKITFEEDFSFDTNELFEFYDEEVDLFNDKHSQNTIGGYEELWDESISKDAYFTKGKFDNLRYYQNYTIEKLQKEIKEAEKNYAKDQAEYLENEIKPQLIEYLKDKSKYKKEENKWKLLFKIASNIKCDMCFWDAGYLEIAIEEDKLRKLDFSNTYARIATS